MKRAIKKSAAPKKAQKKWRIGIVSSMWHRDVLQKMIDECVKILEEAGIPKKQIQVFDAPGSYEVPLIGAALMKTGRVECVIGFGIILQGQTNHADLIAQSCANTMMQLQAHYMIPFVFEILHVKKIELAKERASGAHNKGREAAHAALQALETLNKAKRAFSRTA